MLLTITIIKKSSSYSEYGLKSRCDLALLNVLFMSSPPVDKYLVRVHCATFDHASFITNAMNGFAMQQTSFPFVCTIMDDASTDGAQTVIKNYLKDFFDLQDTSVSFEKETEYGQVIFSRHKTNKNCHFAVILLYENHYSQKKSKASYLVEWNHTKYLALCEGDDYWTDPMKLQKQVDYMESHPDCSLCCHNTVTHWYDGRCPDKLYTHFEDRDYSVQEIIKDWQMPATGSYMYRTRFSQGYSDCMKSHPGIIIGDIPLLLFCSREGHIHALSDVMGVYGKHAGGWTQSFDARKTYLFAYSWEVTREAFKNSYYEVLRSIPTGLYLAAISRSIKEKNIKVLMASVYRGIIRHPFDGLMALLRLPGERKKRIEKERASHE